MSGFRFRTIVLWLFLLDSCYARAIVAEDKLTVVPGPNALGFEKYTTWLQKRGAQNNIKPPISAAASLYWEGNDGPWSSFVLQVGTPPQEVRVLPSTASSSTWVIMEDPGCNSAPIPNCPASRGKTFNSSISGTWKGNLQWSVYDLGVGDQLRDYTVNGDYGFDTVALGHLRGGGPSVRGVVAAVGDTHFTWLGALGLNPRPVNFTDKPQEPFTSLLQQLKDQGNISSLSWAYTAGAQYRPRPVFGSLTFGGYDQSRFEIPPETHSNVTFPFYADIERDLTVSISSITTTKTLASNSPATLLSKGVNALIDSTVAHLWLPKDVCSEFESAFGLQWDPDTELYKVSAADHDKLVVLDPSVTINITPSLYSSASEQSVAITFPYSAFDMNVSWPFGNGPYKNESTYYFPLKRADDPNQYTLGRAFLQEAYVIADYERQNFSVWPCKWDDETTKQNIVPILAQGQTLGSGTPDSEDEKQSRNRLGTKTIAGIAAGGAVAVILLGINIWLYLRRRARVRAAVMELQRIESETSATASPQLSPHPNKSALVTEISGMEKHELHEDFRFEAEPGGKFELDGAGMPHEADGQQKMLLYEMDAGGDGVGLMDSHGELVRITVEPPTAVTPTQKHVLPSPVSAKTMSSTAAGSETDKKEAQHTQVTGPVMSDVGRESESAKSERDGVRSFFGFLKAFRASGQT